MPQNRLAHQLVADRYELLDTVGRGGFGVVWRACDTLLERHVAVKEIHIPGFLEEADRADLRQKVLREARAAARLDHPGAVTVYDVIDDDDGHPVIVMELVEAPNLSQLVAEKGPMEPAAVARIGLEVLEVLEAAHARGIVHRDVKPANVMVNDAGRVRLGDFGVAAILDDPSVTTSGAVTGSPAYMAPEQATNKGAIAASDLWSLAATMYFAVEGVPPFDKGAPLPTLTSIVQDQPRPATRAGALAPVLSGLLVKQPDARLSASQLRDRLGEVASATPAAGPPAGEARAGDTAVLHLEEPIPAEAPATAPAAAVPPTAAAAATEVELATAAAPPPPPRLEPDRAEVRPVAVAGPPLRPAGTNRRTVAVVATVAVVLLALIGIGLSRSGGSGTPAETAVSSPSTAATGSKAGDSSPTTAAKAAPKTGGTTPATSAGGTASTSGAPVAAVGDTVAYTDPDTGFSIARPKNWSVRTSGTLTDFRDPDTGAYLRVDHIQPPGPSPEGAWFDLEKSFAAENADYSRIRIEATTYAGYRAGIWEFTYTSGGAALRVADLGFITPRYGFALYFQTRAGDWDRMQPLLQAFKDSFKAPA